MITKTQATALRITWKARASALTCPHRYLLLERINPKRSTIKYHCVNCGAGVVHQVTPPGERKTNLRIFPPK